MTSYFCDVILTTLLWRHFIVTSFWRRYYDVIFLWRHFNDVMMTSYFCDVILTTLLWRHIFLTSFWRRYDDVIFLWRHIDDVIMTSYFFDVILSPPGFMNLISSPDLWCQRKMVKKIARGDFVFHSTLQALHSRLNTGEVWKISQDRSWVFAKRFIEHWKWQW
jgi:hypothetical protein